MTLSIFFAILAGLFLTFYFGFVAISFLLSLNPFHGWHESPLKQVEHGIWIFGFGRLVGCVSLLWPRHGSLWHKVTLSFVCVYTFLFFNPQEALSTHKSNVTVYCPDGYAFKVDGSHYIRCEDFDEFHADQHNGKPRADLYIK